MGYFGALDISASGLTAQRLRLDTISQNIANISTTHAENGGPYRRRLTVFEERSSRPVFNGYLRAAIKGDNLGRGVRVARVIEDSSPFRTVYEPGHPDADADGYVTYPNVDVVTEMVNMISASRSYEANVTALNTTKGLAAKALEIGR